MIFDALSNAAYRVSLHDPWAELDGGGCSNTPPPGPARSAPSSGPARVKHSTEVQVKLCPGQANKYC